MAGILIVDDNPNIRYLLRVFIESQTPFKICGEASHGTEGIEKARVLQPDLVLLDLAMPVLNGVEAAAVLRGMMPRTKLVLFSMHFDNIPKSLSTVIGVDLTLSKSDGITKLGDHLKALLAPADAVDEIPNPEPEAPPSSPGPIPQPHRAY